MEVLVKNLFVSDNEEGTLQKSNMCSDKIKKNAPSAELNDRLIEDLGLAQAYVPMQNWETPLGEADALTCGTVFSMLVMPYVKGSSLELNRMEVCTDES
mgnify:CR=1 FL=1